MNRTRLTADDDVLRTSGVAAPVQVGDRAHAEAGTEVAGLASQSAGRCLRASEREEGSCGESGRERWFNSYGRRLHADTAPCPRTAEAAAGFDRTSPLARDVLRWGAKTIKINPLYTR